VCAGERNAKVARNQHHDGEGCAGHFGKELGVPNELDATIGNYALRKRRSHHAGKIAVHAPLGCRCQAFQQSARIGRVRISRRDFGGEGHINNAQAIIEQASVTDDNDIVNVGAIGE
jgi:hypothetical protein